MPAPVRVLYRSTRNSYPLLLLLLTLALTACDQASLLDRTRDKGALRVATINSATTFYEGADSLAGLDPTVTWDKGEKRPWNAKLKTLCWKIGESFVKVSGRDNDIYGHVYTERKALEIQRNDAGEYSEQAAAALAHKRYGQETIARAWYEQGKLPPAHIHARAKRYAVKLYLAHWQHVAYEAQLRFKTQIVAGLIS